MTFLCTFFELFVSSVVVCLVKPSLITGCCGLLCCLLGFFFGITAPSMWFTGCMQEMIDIIINNDHAEIWERGVGASSVLMYCSASLLLVCGIIECVGIYQLQGALVQPGDQPGDQPQMSLQQRSRYAQASTVVVEGERHVTNDAAKFCSACGTPSPGSNKFCNQCGTPI